MEFTDIQKLPCLDGEDYAAFALYMQCLANQLDDTLTAQTDELNDFLTRPAAGWTQTAVQSGILDGSPLSTNTVEWQANWPTVLPVASSPQLANRRGWWYVGACANLIPSGVTTANARLEMRMRISGGGFVAAPLGIFSDVTYMSGAGDGENLVTAGTVFWGGTDSPSSFANPTVNIDIFHANASSLTTSLTPAPRVWVAFLGDTPEIVGP